MRAVRRFAVPVQIAGALDVFHPHFFAPFAGRSHAEHPPLVTGPHRAAVRLRWRRRNRRPDHARPDGRQSGRSRDRSAGGDGAAVTVTGPGGYNHSVSATETISGLAPGGYTVAANAVTSGVHNYQPSVGNQTVTVSDLAPASASVAYAEVSPDGFNLRIDGVYLTQSVQTYAGTVPLVKDRDGYLRVFVTASESNAAAPVGPSPVLPRRHACQRVDDLRRPASACRSRPTRGPWAPRGTCRCPRRCCSRTSPSWSTWIPSNVIDRVERGRQRLPDHGNAAGVGRPHRLALQCPTRPDHQSVNGRVGNVDGGNKDSFFTARCASIRWPRSTRRCGPTFTTAAPAVDANNTNGAWGTILSQIDALRVSEGSSRYYYGVANPTYSSGVAGIGYVGQPTAIGWDKRGADLGGRARVGA